MRKTIKYTIPNLEEVRNRTALSQSALAVRCQTAPRTISRLEQGLGVTYTTALKIARCLLKIDPEPKNDAKDYLNVIDPPEEW